MATERPDYDQTLKRLLTVAHDGVLALLLPGARWLGEVSPELHAGKRHADLVWAVALPDGEGVLLHIELQTHPDPRMGERMADYALRLWFRDHRPVHSVVVYLRETDARLPDTFLLPRGQQRSAMLFRYDVVRLWELSADAFLGRPEPALWPLASLSAGATAETVAGVAEQLGRAGLPRREQGELIGLLAVLAGVRLPRDVVAQIVGGNPMLRELLEESSFAEVLREEGEARGMRASVQTVLHRRFGALAEDELAALQAADVPLLREIAAQVLDDTREQMRARLGLPSGS